MRTLIVLALTAAAVAVEVPVPAGVDHGPYERLLQRYVDARGLIDYAGLAAAPADLAALDAYLADLGAAGEPATGDERVAGLINAYNAYTIRAVLRYDVDPDGGSFWSHDPFDDRRYRVGGELVSLDDIEHRALRPAGGYRIHAAVVCAAVSCPPLWRRAFTADNVDAALDERFAVWLARADLNRFQPERDRLAVSKIFDWFAEDFAQAGGLTAVLARHAPERYRAWLADPDAGIDIDYLPYDKTINSQR